MPARQSAAWTQHSSELYQWSFQTIELTVKTIKWLNIDLLRLGLARIPKDFSAGIAPHAALGHPTYRTKTGKRAIRTHAARATEHNRSQSCAGGKFFWARGLRTELKEKAATHRTYKFYRACNCFVLPSFICSSFFPYIHSSIKSFMIHGFFIQFHSSWSGRDQSNHIGKRCLSCVDLFALSCLESLRMMCPITSSSSRACLYFLIQSLKSFEIGTNRGSDRIQEIKIWPSDRNWVQELVDLSRISSHRLSMIRFDNEIFQSRRVWGQHLAFFYESWRWPKSCPRISSSKHSTESNVDVLIHRLFFLVDSNFKCIPSMEFVASFMVGIFVTSCLPPWVSCQVERWYGLSIVQDLSKFGKVVFLICSLWRNMCIMCGCLKKTHPAGNQHIPHQGTFEDDFPFPKVGYVSSLESNCWVVCSFVV